MIGFRLVNFLPPAGAQRLLINTPTGTWELEQEQNYAALKNSVCSHKCAETYSIEHPVSMQNGAAACDAAFEEVTPIVLGASFALGLSVTVKRSLPSSECSIMQPSDHWPRERAMGAGTPIVTTDAELISCIEKTVTAWKTAGASEKALLLIHHWLDALGCWSFEDMYLSATTILQIIAATEEHRQGQNLSFFNGVTDAANRFSISPLSRDFKDMRNDLIHDGRLSGSRFSSKTLNDCAQVAADVFNWVDLYIHAALSLGTPSISRFKKSDFINLNSYSL
tara:strand:- start:195 stop:1034 length:840 start_codon:yes stop_codon:yes gene_type:complete